ncbi:hypothetical protein BOTBODRAFT_32039 [Botryobasidium botryosum FD-172 SS1]|uniref:F-box domain-containing protein n=1 Tax=Botryobasidium botryosum (strain FD-172 SS1) TaxID=930990 RepID=A0A067MHL6_BOTB1|nr:hypothetical protein BOTBODRAFT_32039 [Botryobasidium botryosum FD-172 SS1]
MLQSLHYDLAVMLCTFMDQQSRLAFALTCRWLKGVIIPECLVRSLRLQTARKAAHFCRLILVPNSRVGENVQLLNIDFHRTASASVTQLIANALIRMPNLRHLDLPFPFYGSDHRILREISNLPRLHHLFLGIRDETCIEQLENLRAMESLHFTPTQNLILHPDGVIMNMNLRSTLGDLFLRSRESLSKLTLCMPILERPIPKKAPHDSRDDALEDIWPAVRFLNLRSFPQDRFDHMDLSRMFPAALHFIAPLYHWSSSRASQFMLRLISLEADWVDLQVAVEAGAPLRRAVAATNWVLSIGLWFLPSTLEYLSLAMEGKDLSDFIASAHHATVPNLKALAITIHLRKKRRHDHARLTVSALPIQNLKRPYIYTLL